MQYLWEAFNIKTFPANTIVLVDGKYKQELSDFEDDLFDIKTSKTNTNINIKNRGKLPFHIIYVGSISGDSEISVNLVSPKTNVFITGKINIEKPAFLKKSFQNTGNFSKIESNFLIQNKSNFKMHINAQYKRENTGILDKTKVVAHSDSVTELSGAVIIEKGSENCESKLNFSALCASDIKSIKFIPAQYINSEPKNAEHSASIWRGTPAQIEYLRTSGLSGKEVDATLREAFENG